MTREWKPGDVAMVTAYNKTQPYRAYYDGRTWREFDANMFCVDSPTTHRPLVVIDPEDRETLEKFAAWTADGDFAEWRIDWVQKFLRSLANPTPPKPEEPTGLGAVVEDAEGELWLRHAGSIAPWHRSDGQPTVRCWRYFKDIAAVRVLSEGVTQ